MKGHDTLIWGNYKIGKIIGEGAFGKIYQGIKLL